MRQHTALLTGVGIGVAALFLFDPTSGNRRRRRITDFFTHAARTTTRTAGKVGRDVSNRTRGVVATTRRWTKQETPIDAVLHDRVRAALGHVTSHPHAIHVDADEGRVVLSGPVLQDELDHVLQVVRGVYGVVDVESRLEPHVDPQHIPALQGNLSRSRTRQLRHS